MPYIERKINEEGCLFCNRLDEDDGPENLILHRSELTFVILNRYPYTNGHMMIVPTEHQANLDSLSDPTLSELIRLTAQATTILRNEYGAEAFNVGMNIGEAAGAGVADHVHIHILPRWSGDTNFMATVSETRVVPESLEATYARLRAAWDQ